MDNSFFGIKVVVHTTCPSHFYDGMDCRCDCSSDWQNCQSAEVDPDDGVVYCSNPNRD